MAINETPTPADKQPSQPSTLKQKDVILLGSITTIITVSILTFSFLFASQLSKLKNSPQTTSITNQATKPQSTKSTTSTNTIPQTVLAAEEKTAPQINVVIHATASGQIKGKIELDNQTSSNYTNVNYGISLRSPQTSRIVTEGENRILRVTAGQLVAFNSLAAPNLLAGEKKSISFMLPYSTDIVSGDYVLDISFITENAESINSYSTNIHLTGSSKFLDMDDSTCGVIVDGLTYDPGIAPPLDPGQQAQASCTYTNPTNSAITFTPSISYTDRFIIGPNYLRKKDVPTSESITLQPQEKRQITFTLPLVTTPQVYQALITLVTSDKQSVAPLFAPRWTIKGQSAYIRNIDLDKPIYQKGDKAKVSVQAAPSMDLFWRSFSASGSALAQPNTNEGTQLSNAKLVVTIKSGSGTSCGRGEKNLPQATSQSAWGNQTNLTIPITADCKNPQVEAHIVEGNKTLANLTNNIISPTPPSTIERLSKTRVPLLLMALAITLLIILVTVTILQKRYPQLFQFLNKKTMSIIFIGSIFTVTGFVVFGQQVINGYYEPATEYSNNNLTILPPGSQMSAYQTYGNAWVGGSKISGVTHNTTENKDELRVWFRGTIYGIDCDNLYAGYRISAFIDNSGDGISINGATTNVVEYTLNQSAISNAYDASYNFTVSKPVIPSSARNVRLDIELIHSRTNVSTADPNWIPGIGCNGSSNETDTCIVRVTEPLKTPVGGRIVDQNGNGVGGVRVHVEDTGIFPTVLYQFTTAADGWYNGFEPNFGYAGVIPFGHDYNVRIVQPAGYYNTTTQQIPSSLTSYEWQKGGDPKNCSPQSSTCPGLVKNCGYDVSCHFGIDSTPPPTPTPTPVSTYTPPSPQPTTTNYGCQVVWEGVPGFAIGPNIDIPIRIRHVSSNVGWAYVSLYNNGTRQPGGSCGSDANGSYCDWKMNSGSASGTHTLTYKVNDYTGYNIGPDNEYSQVCLSPASYTVTTSTTGTKPPTVQKLEVGPATETDAVSGYLETYGYSGNRTTIRGKNFNNAMRVKPVVQSNLANGLTTNIGLSGAAFIRPGTTIADFSDLIQAAYDGNGFILIYAHCGGQTSCYIYNRTWERDKFYVYARAFNGWAGPLDDSAESGNFSFGSINNGLIVEIPGDISTGVNTVNTALHPEFNVFLHPNLGNNIWDTWGFAIALDPTNQGAALEPLNPERLTNTAPTPAAFTWSTARLYMFSLF